MPFMKRLCKGLVKFLYILLLIILTTWFGIVSQLYTSFRSDRNQECTTKNPYQHYLLKVSYRKHFKAKTKLKQLLYNFLIINNCKSCWQITNVFINRDYGLCTHIIDYSITVAIFLPFAILQKFNIKRRIHCCCCCNNLRWYREQTERCCYIVCDSFIM